MGGAWGGGGGKLPRVEGKIYQVTLPQGDKLPGWCGGGGR